jgi:hypothetical protein
MAEEEAVVIDGIELFEDDYVKVLHSEGRRDGFVGLLRQVRYNEADEPIEVDVWGGKKGYERMRTFTVDRIHVLSRRTQNRLQQDAEARREQGLRPKYVNYSDVS